MLSKPQRIKDIILFIIPICGLLIGCTAEVKSAKNIQNDLDVNQVLEQVQEDFQEQPTGLESAENLPGAVAEIVDQTGLEATPMIMVDPDQPRATEARISDMVVEGGGPMESAVVSSDGEVIPMQIEEGQISEEAMSGTPPESSLAMPSDAGAAYPEDEVISDPSGWEVFLNRDFGFSFQYPPNFVLVQPGSGTNDSDPQPLAEALLQERHIVDAGLENLEPYRFAVRVFANQNQQGLDQWLKSNRPESSSETGESISITLGGADAIQSCSLLDFAPNCAVYAQHGNYIFEIIPYGEFSSALLKSFRFIN